MARYTEEMIQGAMSLNNCRRDQALSWLDGEPVDKDVLQYRRTHNTRGLDSTRIRELLRRYLPTQRAYQAALHYRLLARSA